MAEILPMLDALARGQERLGQHVDAATRNVDRCVAVVSVLSEEIRAQLTKLRDLRTPIKKPQ